MIYSIFEKPNMVQKANGDKFSDCICEGDTRQEAIEKAKAYLAGVAGETGALDAILVEYDEDTDAEKMEDITIEWVVENEPEYKTVWNKRQTGVI